MKTHPERLPQGTYGCTVTRFMWTLMLRLGFGMATRRRHR